METKNMTKAQLVASIADATKLNKTQVNDMLDKFVAVIRKATKSGSKVRLPGLGTFQPRRRSARKGINPASRQPISIPAKNTVAFKLAQDFKDYLN
ncbi:MAG: HU family DNA-binding protein [Bacilli bacterium]|nr:HU family DNA-binding protein [Bacilli bacterium]